MTTQPGMLRAAVLPVDITPPIGVFMDGYGARQAASNDIHDPLFATVLALETGSAGVVLVTLDLLAVSLEFTRRIRTALSTSLGIPEQHILVTASHTHAGPAGFLEKIPLLNSVEDPVLQEITLRRLSGAAHWLREHMQPARLAVGRGQVSDIGRNRNDPIHGLSDVELLCLVVQTASAEPLAVLINYGCHPTVLGPENLAISADFPGAARAALRKIYPQAAVMFTNGATGDVSTRFTRRGQGFSEVDRMGRILAGEALKIIQVAEPVEEPTLGGRIEPIIFPLRHFPALEEARQQLEALLAELSSLRAKGAAHGQIRKAVTRVEGAQVQLLLVESMGGMTNIETQMQILQAGPLALVGVPGETFTHTVLSIKNHSPNPFTAIASYANDYRGYFPDAGSIASGTYEALSSPYDERAADLIERTALKLMEKMLIDIKE